MSEGLKMGISLFVGAIVFIFCYIKVFLSGRSSKQKLIARAEASGNYTKGTCIHTKRLHGNNDSNSPTFHYDSMVATYEYFVNGISYKKKIEFQSQALVSIRCPHFVTVYYDPQRPGKGVCKEEATQGQQRSRGCLSTIIFTALAIMIVSNLLKLL